MTTRVREGDGDELRLELKYCERCGGLWLRPAGGGQIYCAACGKAMAELPEAKASHKARGARMPVGPPWEETDYDSDGYEFDAGVDFDTTGGVA